MIVRGSIDKSSYKLRHRIYTVYNFYRPVLLPPPYIKKLHFFKEYYISNGQKDRTKQRQYTKDRRELRKQEETYPQ